MHDATLPTISVVMPVLNREDTIEKAIQSVINQDYPNVELIILDGGSKDKTVDIIKRYENYITYWHSQRDGSAAIAANIGIQKASGDFIALLMADDWFEPDTFKKVAEAFLAHKDAEMITCAGRILAYDEKNQSYVVKQLFNKKEQLELTFYNICFAVSAICCRFIKKSLHERIGLYIPLQTDGKQFLTNDKEFLLRATLQHVNNVFVDHMGYTYFAHKESYSFSNNRKSYMRHCCEHMSIATDYLSKQNVSLKQKLLLHYWYNDQAIRLILYSLLEGDKRAAFTIFKNTLRKYHIIALGFFSYTSMRIAIKKLRTKWGLRGIS